MTKIHLVDASPYIFRAYFSIPSSMTGRAGTPVNAVYGFATFLLKLLQDEGVTHLGLAFDRSLTTSFRNELYADYKAQRELPPKELEAQLTWCEQLASALGAATYVDERYEADDLIGGLCRCLREGAGSQRAEPEIVIVTSDKDLAQLVDQQVTLFDFARGERLGTEEVVSKLGVPPHQVTDLLGLAGDSVDNIPGVRGVGPKTAVALLGHYATLEAALEDLDGVAALPLRGAKSLARKLAEQREEALLSKQLATIAQDLPASAKAEELRLQGAQAAALEPLCEELGFGKLRERLLAVGPATA